MDEPTPAGLDPADLDALLDLEDDALLVRDLRSDAILFWNRGAAALYGWTAAEALGRATDELLRTFPPATLGAIGELLRRDGRWSGELRRAAKDGRPVTVDSRWALRPARAGGAPLVLLEIDRPVVARHAAASVRGLLESSPDAVVAVDSEGRIALVNAAAERLYGYDRNEILGQPEELLLPGGLRERHAGERAAYLAAPRARAMGAGLELSGRRRDGSTFPAEAYLVVLPSEDGPLAAAIVRDLTDRRRWEAAQDFLIRAGALLAGSLDYEATLGQVLRLAVPALADFAALDLVDDAGRLMRLGMAHADPDEDAALRDLTRREPLVLARETATTRALRTGTVQLIADVGDVALAELAQDAAHLALLRRLAPRSLLLVPLVARGRARGVVVLGFAGSGRRYGEADRTLAAELAARAALAIDNARLYRQAQDALAVRDDFIATVTHDLRNPLAVARMAAQTLAYQARASAPPPADLADGLADIDRAVARADAMVEQLLDVARLQAGRPLALRRRTADLVALARQAAADQQRLARAHTIVVAAAEERLVGRWDAERVERVVANLVGNAVKYSPAGGAVTLTLRREGDQAVLSVGDQGIGIPAADLERVFQPFQRASNVGATAGTGIGLASAKQIMEQHGGAIAVESVEGQGTTVTIRLPLPEPDGEPPARA